MLEAVQLFAHVSAARVVVQRTRRHTKWIEKKIGKEKDETRTKKESSEISESITMCFIEIQTKIWKLNSNRVGRQRRRRTPSNDIVRSAKFNTVAKPLPHETRADFVSRLLCC